MFAILRRKIATQFLTAFVIAGLIEETLKYFLIAVYPAYQGISHLFGIFVLSAAGATGMTTVSISFARVNMNRDLKQLCDPPSLC